MLRLAMLFLLITAALHGGPTSRSERIDRISAFGRLWAEVKWTSPMVGREELDWDKAIVDALPDISSARKPDEIRGAIEKMMLPLRDPCFRIDMEPGPNWTTPSPVQQQVVSLKDNWVLVSLNQAPDPNTEQYNHLVNDFFTLFESARGLIIDLRPSKDNNGNHLYFIDQIIPYCIVVPVELPSFRYRFHSGYAPQLGPKTGGFGSGLLTTGHTRLIPLGSKEIPMIFIVNAASSIPHPVLALQRAGLAFVVSEGTPELSWVVPTKIVPVSPYYSVRFSSGDLSYPDGTWGMGADKVIQPDPLTGPNASFVNPALDLWNSALKAGGSIAWNRQPAFIWEENDRAYKDMTFPSLQWRQLAIFRFWSIIDKFFPYKNLTDESWENILPEFLLKIETVKNSSEYISVIAEMAAKTKDNHAWVTSSKYWKLMGYAPSPLILRPIEGKIVIERFLAPDLATKAGLSLWDEVLEIDGEPVKDRMRRMEPYVSSANPWSRDYNISKFLDRGAEGSSGRFKIRNSTGKIKNVILPRTLKLGIPDITRRGDLIKIYPNSTAYVDLERLLPDQVDALFEKVRNCKSLILDMRGYPKSVVWKMLPYLNRKGEGNAAYFMRNFVTAHSTHSMSIGFYQKLPPLDVSKMYKGRVVMLINERTVSQAEHTGLLIEMACNLTYIGSPSAGSNGDVTNLILPGGVGVNFSGHDVRHADGKQLQRVGIQPHILIYPTLRGLRKGHDEVLDRALSFLHLGR